MDESRELLDKVRALSPEKKAAYRNFLNEHDAQCALVKQAGQHLAGLLQQERQLRARADAQIGEIESDYQSAVKKLKLDQAKKSVAEAEAQLKALTKKV